MRVIMLSTDRNLFAENSETRRRIKEYGDVLGDLSIVVLGRDDRQIKLSDKVTIYGTGSFHFIMYIFDAVRLILKINGFKKADWISSQDPFETGLIAYLANILIKTKLQYQIHTDIGSPYFRRSSLLNAVRFLLGRMLLPRADNVRVVSKKIAEFLVSLKIAEKKITVLPVLIDFDELDKNSVVVDLKKEYPQFEKIVIMASRFAPEKDFQTALEAFKHVMLRWNKAGLIIIGEGPERHRIESLVRDLGLSDNVVIESWKNDLFSYFRSADLYLLSSVFEGYGRTLIEASYAGTPFVSTDVGCARELIESGVPGEVVPVRDREGLAEAIIKKTRGREKTIPD